MGDAPDWRDTVEQNLLVLRNPESAQTDILAAGQELAKASKADNRNEQQSRQNTMQHMGVGDACLELLSTSRVEQVRWWMSLVLAQLVFNNAHLVETMVDFSVIPRDAWSSVRPDPPDPEHFTAKECLIKALTSILRNERSHATDRVRYGCLFIATNIAQSNYDAHMVMFHHGLVKSGVVSLKLGNTSALVSVAIGLVACLSQNNDNMHRLLKLGAMRGIRNVARAQKSEMNSAGAAQARSGLEAYAASRVTAIVRGFLGRLRAADMRHARVMKRLGNFFTNAVVWKCFLRLGFWREYQIKYRADIKKAGALLFNSTIAAGFKAFQHNVHKKRNKYGKHDAALSFLGQSPVSRDRLFHKWKEYMREHGAWWAPDQRMERQIAAKCKSFVAHLAGHWVSLCFEGWKELLVKKHRAMSRWKNSSLHFAVDLWVLYMSTEGPWWEPDEQTKRLLDEKCGSLIAHMSGDFQRAALIGWADVSRKARRARARFLHASLSFAFDTWTDETFVAAAELMDQAARAFALLPRPPARAPARAPAPPCVRRRGALSENVKSPTHERARARRVGVRQVRAGRCPHRGGRLLSISPISRA